MRQKADSIAGDVDEVYEALRAITADDMAETRLSVSISKRQVRAWKGGGRKKRDEDEARKLATVKHPLDPTKSISWMRIDIASPRRMMVFMSETQADYLATPHLNLHPRVSLKS